MKGYNGFYLMADYPSRAAFLDAARKGLEVFDFLEIGIPFTDPVADGPVITDAAERVLDRGFRFDDFIGEVARLRGKTDLSKKFYFMCYANTVFSRGIEAFAGLCEKAGVSGVIIPDVPFVESPRFKKVFAARGIDFIHFLTPENTDEQIARIVRQATGFVYFVSIRGTTGTRLALDRETSRKIALARKLSPAPVVLGFGISDVETAREALRHADGFVIGSKIIQLLEDNVESASAFCNELAAGV